MGTLHLTLKKKWFDMIKSGQKLEEYREIKPYWTTRLESGKSFDSVTFKNGYAKNAPEFTIELNSIVIGVGRKEWGAPENAPVYILKLGSITHIRTTS